MMRARQAFRLRAVSFTVALHFPCPREEYLAVELADGIEAALGAGPVPLLRPLPVDLEELAGVLEGDPVTGGGRIDLRTGEVWPQPAIEYAKETGDFDDDEEDDEERLLWVDCEGSHTGYRDMELFIAAVEDTGRADRLSIAIGGEQHASLRRETGEDFWRASSNGDKLPGPVADPRWRPGSAGLGTGRWLRPGQW